MHFVAAAFAVQPNRLDQADFPEIVEEGMNVGGGYLWVDVEVLKYPVDQVLRGPAFRQQAPELSAQLVKGIDRLHIADPGANGDDNGLAGNLARNSSGIADEQQRFYRYRYCCHRFTVFSAKKRVSSAETAHCFKSVQGVGKRLRAGVVGFRTRSQSLCDWWLQHTEISPAFARVYPCRRSPVAV